MDMRTTPKKFDKLFKELNRIEARLKKECKCKYRFWSHENIPLEHEYFLIGIVDKVYLRPLFLSEYKFTNKLDAQEVIERLEGFKIDWIREYFIEEIDLNPQKFDWNAAPIFEPHPSEPNTTIMIIPRIKD